MFTVSKNADGCAGERGLGLLQKGGDLKEEERRPFEREGFCDCVESNQTYATAMLLTFHE